MFDFAEFFELLRRECRSSAPFADGWDTRRLAARKAVAEARVHALEKALERIWTTQVYEEPGKPAKGLNVEFVAAVRAARAVVLEGARGDKDLGGDETSPVVPS